LVVLALSVGEPVTIDRLAVAVWGYEFPKNARRAVQVYVTRLRRILGPGLIRTVPAGYVLMTEPAQVDVVRFTRLLDAAPAAADPAAERALLVQALSLWRGEPFDGVRSPWLDSQDAPQLVDRRLAALERRIDLDLAMGRADELVGELRGLIARHPLRERLWAHLMTALYRAGRQADALAAYRRLYRLLGDELGIEPSASMQELHHRVLRDDLALESSTDRRSVEPPVPRQLPASIGCFVGRSDSLDRLDALLPTESKAASTTVVISAIAGSAGVGKTALAVHWARRVADRFPDGQLHVNLRGFDPSGPPVSPDDVIHGFLDALGVSPHRVPTDPQAQVGLYRSLMAGKRMLVLLDNARDADQVRPLLPGADNCVVVVTSRNRLVGLVAHDGAHPVNIDVLARNEALRLLAARLGPERIAIEPRSADEIIERCARLPLALTIVAARAVAHPTFPLAALAGELREAQDRLDVLAGEDPADPATNIRAVFSNSYRILTPDAARLFRLLGLHRGPDTSAPAAASLAGLPRAQAGAALAELATVHMILEHRPGRYALHDLLRAYAAELATEQESAEQRREAVRRLLDHYLHTTHAAARQLNPDRDHPATNPDCAAGVHPEDLGAGGSAVLSWFAAEHSVLMASIDLAADTGLDSHAWQMAWALGAYLARSGRWQGWAATQRAALAAAERQGDRCEQARAYRGLARACLQLGHFEDADTHLRHALRLGTEIDARAGLGHTHLALAQLLEKRGDIHAGLHHAELAVNLFRRFADPAGQALALNAAGWCHARVGDYRRALNYCGEALSRQRKIGDRYGEATTWDSLGYTHHHLGGHQKAIVCYRNSIALRHDGGERYGEAWTLLRLGDTQLAHGDPQAAGEAWERAAAILDDLGDPEADQTRVRLRWLSAVAV
jgi:DNA-binding SARP family transcriptional activator